MPGFPNRIRRASLGPELEDTWPVTDERKAIPARTFGLAWWQLAGCNLTAGLGLIGVRIASGQPVTFFQALAFDPDGLQPLLAWTRPSTGVYAYSFPQSSYSDENGNLVTLSLLGGMAHCQSLVSTNDVRANHVKTGPRSGVVRMLNLTNTNNPLIDLVEGNEFILQLV